MQDLLVQGISLVGSLLILAAFIAAQYRAAMGLLAAGRDMGGCQRVVAD